jgi:hypothetical protein
MAKIRVQILLNKGRIGIPLYKLGAILRETEAFLSMLGQDIELPGDKKQWLTVVECQHVDGVCDDKIQKL